MVPLSTSRALPLALAVLLAAIGSAVTVALLTAPAPAQAPIATPPAPTAYARCELALTAAHALWSHSGAEHPTPECDQPTVTYQEYQHAWRAVGGDTWTAAILDDPHTQH